MHTKRLAPVPTMVSASVRLPFISRVIPFFFAFIVAASGVNAYDNSRNDNVSVGQRHTSYKIQLTLARTACSVRIHRHSRVPTLTRISSRYWGQDSAGNQQTLQYYCADDTINAFPLAFLYIFFGEGGAPVIDFANVRPKRIASHIRRDAYFERDTMVDLQSIRQFYIPWD